LVHQDATAKDGLSHFIAIPDKVRSTVYPESGRRQEFRTGFPLSRE
jgi:hypothetical protein